MSHECPGAGCTFQVGRAQLACKRHWYSLPKALRDRIWLTYRSGDAESHREAVLEACLLLDPALAERVIEG